MTAYECEFEHEGYCCPPKEFANFVCPSSILETNGLRRCDGNNSELMTEEEWEEKEANKQFERMRMDRDDWEMKGYQR